MTKLEVKRTVSGRPMGRATPENLLRGSRALPKLRYPFIPHPPVAKSCSSLFRPKTLFGLQKREEAFRWADLGRVSAMMSVADDVQYSAMKRVNPHATTRTGHKPDLPRLLSTTRLVPSNLLHTVSQSIRPLSVKRKRRHTSHPKLGFCIHFLPPSSSTSALLC